MVHKAERNLLGALFNVPENTEEIMVVTNVFPSPAFSKCTIQVSDEDPTVVYYDGWTEDCLD